LGEAILRGTPALGYNSHVMDGLRGSEEPIPNHEVFEEESPHQAQIPLPPAASPTRVANDPPCAWEGQPGRSPNEAAPYEFHQQIEEALDEDEWLQSLMRPETMYLNEGSTIQSGESLYLVQELWMAILDTERAWWD